MTSLFGVALDESRPQSINSSRKRRREEELKQENATLKAQFEKKEAKVQKLKFDFNILKYAKEKADERLSELEKVHEGFLQNQKKVEEETNTLKSENNALKLEKKALETEKQKEVDKLTQSLKQETGAKLLLQKKYIKLETEVKDLKTKLQEVTEKSASISQEELANLKKEHEKELVNLRKENENLQNTLFQMELKEKKSSRRKKVISREIFSQITTYYPVIRKIKMENSKDTEIQ
jgi:chromosome segregation ATPase